MNPLITKTEKLTEKMTDREAGIYAFSLFCQNLADCFERGDNAPAPLPASLKNRQGAMWYCRRLIEKAERYQIFTLQAERIYWKLCSALQTINGYSPARYESDKADLLALHEQTKAFPTSPEQAQTLAKITKSLKLLENHKATMETAPEITILIDRLKEYEQGLCQGEREFTAFCEALGLDEATIREGLNMPKSFMENEGEAPTRANGADGLLKDILALPD